MIPMQQGKLEQVCPTCGTWEAAGTYCSKCLSLTPETAYYRNGDVKARKARQDVAGKMPRTPPKRGRGRPRRVSGAA